MQARVHVHTQSMNVRSDFPQPSPSSIIHVLEYSFHSSLLMNTLHTRSFRTAPFIPLCCNDATEISPMDQHFELIHFPVGMTEGTGRVVAGVSVSSFESKIENTERPFNEWSFNGVIRLDIHTSGNHMSKYECSLLYENPGRRMHFN
jgi:hypothetical protein